LAIGSAGGTCAAPSNAAHVGRAGNISNGTTGRVTAAPCLLQASAQSMLAGPPGLGRII